MNLIDDEAVNRLAREKYDAAICSPKFAWENQTEATKNMWRKHAREMLRKQAHG